MGNTHPPLWFEPYPDGFSECPQWAPKERASAGGQDQVVENGLHNTDGPVSSTSDRVLSSNDVFHDMPITEPFLDHPIAAYMNDESKYRVGNIPSRFGRNVLNPELRVENPEQHMVNGQDYNQYYSSTWPKQPSQWNPDLHFPYNDNVEGIIGSSSRVNNSINNSQGNLMDRYLGSMLQSPFQYDDCFRYPNERTFPSAEYPDDLLADTDPHSRKWTSQMLLAYDSSARFGVDNAVISSNLHQQYQQGQLAPGNLNEVISTNREGLWNELSTLSDLPVLVPAGADVLLQSPTFTCLTAQNGDIKPHLQSSEKVANSVVDVMRLESQVLRQALKNTLTSSWASVQPISDETPNESSQKLEAEAACLAACLRCRIRKKACKGYPVCCRCAAKNRQLQRNLQRQPTLRVPLNQLMIFDIKTLHELCASLRSFVAATTVHRMTGRLGHQRTAELVMQLTNTEYTTLGTSHLAVMSGLSTLKKQGCNSKDYKNPLYQPSICASQFDRFLIHKVCSEYTSVSSIDPSGIDNDVMQSAILCSGYQAILSHIDKSSITTEWSDMLKSKNVVLETIYFAVYRITMLFNVLLKHLHSLSRRPDCTKHATTTICALEVLYRSIKNMKKVKWDCDELAPLAAIFNCIQERAGAFLTQLEFLEFEILGNGCRSVSDSLCKPLDLVREQVQLQATIRMSCVLQHGQKENVSYLTKLDPLQRNYKTYKPFVDVLRENSVSSPDDPFQGKEPGASHRFEQTKHDSATFARHLAVLNDQFIDQCSTSDSRAPASRTDTRSSVYSVTKSVHLDNSPLPYLDTSAVKIEQTLDYEELRGQDLSSHQAMSEEIDRFFNAPQDTTAPEKEAEVNLSRSALGEAYSYLRSTSTNRTPALTEADSSEDKSRISELFGSEGFDHNMNSEPWLTQETPATLYPLEFTTSLEILDKYFKPSALTADPPKPKRKRLTASSSFDLSESQQTVPTTCERHGKVPKLSYDCIKD